MNLLDKIKFFLRRPPIIIASGEAQEAIKQVLDSHFRLAKEVLMVSQDFNFFIKYSRLPILVADQSIGMASWAEILPAHGYLILNSDDDEKWRELKNKTKGKVISFGMGARADIKASDLTETNFKINYRGNIVPVWLEKISGKEQIYAVLAAAAVSEVLGLNLVEISEALKKNWQVV